jgi:hypothetical protein
MRVERAHHVAHHLGRFLVGTIGIEAEQPHAVEDAAVHRLQAIAGIRQGALGDRREGVGQVALFEGAAQVDDIGMLAGWGRGLVVAHR